MPKKLIVANWKMQPQSLAEAEGIVEAVDGYFSQTGEHSTTAVVFCPPFVFLEEVAKLLGQSHLEHQAFLGAQDIAVSDDVAQTGEVSGPQLAKLGVRYVIVGHSERRWKLGESDEVVNEKLRDALRNELVPIVCVGERERGAGDRWRDELATQVRATFAGLSADDVGRCLVAYEPVWAISTTPGARPDTPDAAAASIQVIRDVLSRDFGVADAQALYGGSITDVNALEFLSNPAFAGVLVGGASVRKDEFVRILGAADAAAS